MNFGSGEEEGGRVCSQLSSKANLLAKNWSIFSLIIFHLCVLRLTCSSVLFPQNAKPLSEVKLKNLQIFFPGLSKSFMFCDELVSLCQRRGGAMEDKRGQKGVEEEERKQGHSNFSHVRCLLFFVHISPSHDALDTTHSNMLTCIATRMGESHSVGLKPRLSVSDFTLKKKKKNRIESLDSSLTWCTVQRGLSQLFQQLLARRLMVAQPTALTVNCAHPALSCVCDKHFK